MPDVCRIGNPHAVFAGDAALRQRSRAEPSERAYASCRVPRQGVSQAPYIMAGMPATYAELAAMDNRQERGYAFEHYVGELLRREQFEVVTRPSAANGRRIDLFATRGERHYLLETKWRKAAAGVAEVDELARRLERGATEVVGVLVSATGFTRSAVERVERDATRAIVLVDGRELADLERAGSLHRLLVAKHDHLIVHRRAAVSTFHAKPSAAATPRTSGQGRYAFAYDDGERWPMTELAGDFGPLVFCLDLPDLDWSQGTSVALELPLAGSDTTGLTQVFERLDERGWITPAGTWRIHQQGATWSGFGLAPLLATLRPPVAIPRSQDASQRDGQLRRHGRRRPLHPDGHRRPRRTRSGFHAHAHISAAGNPSRHVPAAYLGPKPRCGR